MNEKNLTRALQDIVEHDLPKDIEMWNKIETQLPVQASPRGILRFATAPMLALIITVLLVLSTATYAFLGPGSDRGDQGLSGAEQAGLFTEINQTRTIEDIEVTLSKAYADSQRIAIQMDVDPENFDIDNDFFVAELWTQDGMTKFLDSSAGYGQDKLDLVFTGQVVTVNDDGEFIFDPENDDYLDHVGDELNLELRLFLVESFMTNLEVDGYRDMVSYQFTLPISQAIELNLNETREANGIDVELQTLRMAPSQSLITLCISLPDSQDWQPRTALTIDGVPAQRDGLRMSRLPTLEETNRCFEQSFNIFYDQNPSEIVVAVDRIQLPAQSGQPEYWEEVARILSEDYDIEIENVFEGRGHRLEEINRPDGMTDAEFWEAVMQAQSDASPSIEGPWIFEFTLD